MLDGRPLSVLTLAVGVLAACGASAPNSSTATPSEGTTSTGSVSPTVSPATSGPTTLSTGSTSLGTVLTTPQGLTLYYFAPEKGSVVVCTGTCATNWPPLKASGAETKPSNVTGTLGTVALPDGSMQVTYNGWPLHTYAGDTAAGQTNGQGVGGKWFAATPSLSPGGAATAAATSNPSGGY
jgi:predicted lipoprotein with Yx(FWY)xxD motif